MFSGGRGSGVLLDQLLARPDVDVTLAINGYDDGASTGEVRRFLGDALGPSDYRKNASRAAIALRTCDRALIDLLDARLPDVCDQDAVGAALTSVARGSTAQIATLVGTGAAPPPSTALEIVARWIAAFLEALQVSGYPFDFTDCSVGNLVFAGAYLHSDRRFNFALQRYCDLLKLPQGLIENVTDGSNAFLVALSSDGRVLPTEADIVQATAERRQIDDIFLLAAPPTASDLAEWKSRSPDSLRELLAARSASVTLNPRVAAALAEADLIIYAPGTQHSSLFPSYMTPGVSTALAGNLTAIKLLITNIQQDAEIAGRSAVDLIERAAFYLKQKGRDRVPTPSLITHYVVNDPGASRSDSAHVPLGRLDAIEDPRLVRIANYEDGVTGRHDAAKLLAPFIQTLLVPDRRCRIAVWLRPATSSNKVTQTLIEMVRGGIRSVNADVEVLVEDTALDAAYLSSLPFAVRSDVTATDAADALTSGSFDYVLLFDSSGMYHGEDAVSLLSLLPGGRLDAVWGSRRLSVRDVHESYQLRYRRNPLMGALSYYGSHLLSLVYLMMYGRFVSDTLSGARACRSSYLAPGDFALRAPELNQRLLSRLLADRAEMLELPVRFVSMSPELVERPGVVDGLAALVRIVWWRIRGIEAYSSRARTNVADGAAAPSRAAGRS